MTRLYTYLLITLFGTAASGIASRTNLPPALQQTPGAAPPAAKGITFQEILVSGPTQIKMHSLIMLSEGNTQEPIDESYLPGLKSCAENPSTPFRSLTARIIGEHLIEGKEEPHPEAVRILTQLAGDKVADVRFNAVYYGLSRIKNKSPEIVELLIDVVATHPGEVLQERIAESLEAYRDQVTDILDEKLKGENSIAYFEIYEELTGREPAQAEKYMDLPSTRPRMFVVQGQGTDKDAIKAALEEELKSIGIENFNIRVHIEGDTFAAMITTYMPRNHKTVRAHFAQHDDYRITQDMWLSPQLELQVKAIGRW